MNDKINELYKQAHDNIQDCGGHLYYDENFNPEKFAELIVKECISICENTCIPIEISEWKDMTKKEMSAFTAIALAKEIRKEFGV